MAVSNLGFLTVHRLAGLFPGIGVERFFHPLKTGIPHPPPYYSFETKRPLGDFDIFAFSFSFEGDFDRIPAILGPLGIPILASERNSRRHPVLIAGGAAIASNGNALSKVFDVLVPGEAETVLGPILGAMLESGPRPENVSEIPGVWVPGIKAHPNPISIIHSVESSPAYSHIQTRENIFGGASLIEVMRGCPRNCAFCLAKNIYFPPRPLPPEKFKEWIDKKTDPLDLGLVAPSLFDHPQIEEILSLVAARGGRIRNSSVKWEKLSDKILSLLFQCGVRGLTLAPESGSKTLCRSMFKPLQERLFFDTIERISKHGFEHLKFYFIAGLPFETADDLDADIDLISRIHDLGKNLFKTMTANFSGFVPKHGTAWADRKALEFDQFRKVFSYLKMKLKKISGKFKFRFESPQEICRQVYLSSVGSEYALELDKEARSCRERGTTQKKSSTDLDF